MEYKLSEKEKYIFCPLHKSTTADPLWNSTIVAGYTGFIPGKWSSCGKTCIEETKEAVALCTMNRLKRMEYETAMVKNLKDIPNYFSLWYEIPRNKHHVCNKCINTVPENMKKRYCYF